MTEDQDLSKFPLAFLGKDTGVAIDQKSNSLILLTRRSDVAWNREKYQIDDLRSIEKAKVEPGSRF